MIFKITSIQFDLTGDSSTNEEQLAKQSYSDDLNKEVMSKPWFAENQEDLSDVISDEIGWCVKELTYEVI